jgi:hypothetical protein
MNRKEVKAVAADLDQYMTFRAAKEEQEYSLGAALFEHGLKAGIRLFFGIEVDETGIVCDHRQPKVFLEWAKAVAA